MQSDTTPRVGVGACLAAALCSLLLPGFGHLIIRARWRAAVVSAAVLNIVATGLAIWIAAPIDSRSVLADVIADRVVLAGLFISILALAGTRMWSAIDSAWMARPPDGTAARLGAVALAATMIVVGVAPLAVSALDGTIALAYARSRTADSDYRRMSRQRCVLAAVATAAAPRAVATGLPDLMSAFGNAVRTDIPRERLGEFAQLLDRFTAAGGLNSVRTLHLAPPLVSPTRWDALQVRLLVTSVIKPFAAPSVDPAAPTQPVPLPTQPAPILANAC